MEEAFERLMQAIEYLRDIGKSHNQQDLADTLRMSKANFSRAVNGAPRYFTKGFLERFASAYSDYVNRDWLVLGVGKMEKANIHTTRPHIPMSVAAGPTGVAIATISEAETEHRPIIPDLPPYDFTIGVMGESMIPVLSDGDTVACRRIQSINEIKLNRIYVIETTDGAVVKQILRISDNGVTLHSLNTAFPDYTITPSSIISISQIVGLIRPFPI